MEYNYTIIIPHKNTPGLLQRCLDSIPQRDDVQVIVVDDDSSEDKVDFRVFPGIGRKNTLCIFDKSGKGAGCARNIGLKHAVGKWVIFSDADDILSSQLDAILDEHIHSPYDLTYFDVESVMSDTLLPSNRSENYKRKLNRAICDDDMDLLRYKMTSPWGKIILRDLIERHHIEFDETPVSNDVFFSLLVGYHAKRVNAIKKHFCTVTVSSASLMYQNNAKNLWCRLHCAAKANAFLYSINKSQYHVNLFAYEFYFRRVGIVNMIKTFAYSIKHTPLKYILPDLNACLRKVNIQLLNRNKLQPNF